MKAVKILGILLFIYIVLVAAFESLLGYYQPEGARTLVITTTDADGDAHDRVLTALQSGGQLYVAVNHWPRAWYHRALKNPNVQITRQSGGVAETRDYLAVLVSGEERARVKRDNPVGLMFRIQTGFPPRHFIRLDPSAE